MQKETPVWPSVSGGEVPGDPGAPTARPPEGLGTGMPVAATIYQPSRSAMTSGPAIHPWLVEFEPRSRQFVEPLMGWTAGGDPLRQVTLSFPTKDAAIAYARRNGFRFTVRESRRPHPTLRRYADNFPLEPEPPAGPVEGV